MSLRVVHCVGFYFPDPIGGTEVYVRDLAAALADQGIESPILASTDGPGREYAWDDIPVVRYPPNADREHFQKLVRQLAPDLFHLHSWTTGAGLEHLRHARELGIPSVATLHVPAPLCIRGTMLLDGKQACDGRIDDRRCARCWALGRGVPAPAASLLSHLPKWQPPKWVSTTVFRRIATLASARTIAASQAERLQELADLCERVIVPSEWVRQALRANAIPAAKIVLNRQAASDSFAIGETRLPTTRDKKGLSIGFVGRLEIYKGVQTLIAAMAHIPRQTPVRLIVAGTSNDAATLRMIEDAAARDPRIELVGSLEHDRIPTFLATLDILAVPSHWMETGPIVVLEAQAMGVPVMGADLGGIAERVRDGIDGWLLPFDAPRAWAAAIEKAVADSGEVTLRAINSRRTRTTRDIASEMAALYAELHGQAGK